MIPILFEGTETQFTSNGIGRLSDAISCIVTENRNGAYELEMKYPIDGIHFSDIQLGRYIFAKPAKYSDKQAFEIYQITRPINGVCAICAYHISYRLAKIPVMPNSTNSISTALNNLVTYAAETNPFTFTTTKSTVANYNLTEPRDARSCLGGVQGSILDVFGGGDYEFDMFNVKLWSDRGSNRGFQVRYGKNLTDIKQEESIENTITGICPYYKNESTTITLPEKVIETESASNYPYHRTIPVDLSSNFESEVPTEAQLRAAANAYIASHNIGVPKVSLEVSFVNLADMPGYEDIAVLEDIRLCDTVKVVFEKLGVSASAKVISTEYDTLKEKFTKVGLGEPSSTSLAARIADQEKKTEEQADWLQLAIERATNLITGVAGGYVVMHTGEDGKPYEILIMDNEDISQAVHVWRWNKNGWGYSSTGYDGTYSLAATIDGGIVADFIKAGVISGIEINNGNGTFRVDSSGNMTANNGHFEGDIDGSTITGSTLATANGIKITNNVIEFTEWVNALRAVHTINGVEQTATAVYFEDAGQYGISMKLLNGTISMQTLSDTLSFAPSQYSAFRCNVVIDHELTVNGNTSLDANLSVTGNITGDSVYSKGAVQVNKNTSTGQYGNIGYDANAGNFNFQHEGGVFANVAAANFIQASSKLVKENIEDIEDAEKILKLRPVEFDYKFGGHSFGFIAEEVEEVLPNLVHTPKDYDEQEVIDGDYTKSKKLAYDEFVPYLVKMIQNQQEEINELRAEINELKGEK